MSSGDEPSDYRLSMAADDSDPLMSSRWRAVTEIVGEAWEMDPDSRRRYLDRVCLDDALLRAEAESLLAEQDKLEGFLEESAGIELLGPKVSAGQQIGPYGVQEQVGEGAAGIVFRATDSRLGRTVALKVLKGGNTLARRHHARFLVEARAIAALNHPNIVTVYDVGASDEIEYIAMEFVDGLRLDRLIAQGPIPMPSILKYSDQIAGALAKAHALGVIHRDLKPGNVIIDKGDSAKILDFGLAKHTRELPPAEESAPLLIDKDWSGDLTLQGTIMGTPSYMSPEQACGEPASDRSDVFSFGALLYEMVAGRRAFECGSEGNSLQAIVRREPKRFHRIAGGVPPRLRSLIWSCLNKDPRKRPAIDEVLCIIGQLRSRSWRGVRVLTGIAAVALIGFLIAVFVRSRPAENAQTPEAVPLTRLAGYELNGALSPDGKQVAFSWNGDGGNFDLYLKSVGSGEIRRLTTDPAHDLSPSWSPDGQSIAFIRLSASKRELLVIPVHGGAERLICTLHTLQPKWVPYAAVLTQSIGPAWTPDGKFVAVSDLNAKEQVDSIYLVSLRDGHRRKLTSPPAGSAHDYFPPFSPSGRKLAFIRSALGENDRSEILIQELGSGALRRLSSEVAIMTGLTWLSEEKIVFSSDRSGSQKLWSLSLHQRRPSIVNGTDGDAVEPNALPAKHALVYTSQFWNSDVWRVPLAQGHSGTPTELIASSGMNDSAQYSPDGKRIAFVSDRSGHSEIWICAADGSASVQLTHRNGRSLGSPRWSPDGRRIAYDSLENGHSAIFIADLPSGRSRAIVAGEGDYMMPTWSRDGKSVYFTAQKKGRIMRKPVGSGNPEVVTAGRGETFESPDGKYLYQIRWGAGVDRHVWRVPITGGSGVPVTGLDQMDCSRHFVMSAQGIYMLSTDHAPWIIVFYSFRTHKVTPVFEINQALRLGTPSLSVSPDGRWLIYAQMDQSGSDLMLLGNVH